MTSQSARSAVRERHPSGGGSSAQEAGTLLSICVLSYDGREVLENCLEAIRRHSGALAPEVVVMDNGSSDGTSEMVRERFPGFALMRNERNQAFTRAFNRLVEGVTGRYVLVMSNDVELQEGTLDRLVEYLEANPRAGAVIPQSIKPDGTLERVCRRDSGFLHLLLQWTVLGQVLRRRLREIEADEYSLEQEQAVEVAQDSCILLRREMMESVGLFDESLVLYYTEDDLCMRMRRAGWTIGYYPLAKVHHLHSFTTKRRMNPIRVRWLYVQDMLRYSGKYLGGARTNVLLRPLAYLTLAARIPGWAWQRVVRGS